MQTVSFVNFLSCHVWRERSGCAGVSCRYYDLKVCAWKSLVDANVNGNGIFRSRERKVRSGNERSEGSVQIQTAVATEPSRRFRYFAATEPSIVLTVPQIPVSLNHDGTDGSDGTGIQSVSPVPSASAAGPSVRRKLTNWFANSRKHLTWETGYYQLLCCRPICVLLYGLYVLVKC